MDIAAFTKELAKAGATPEAIAVAVDAVETFRRLPEASGRVTKYEWEIWRKVERIRKRSAGKKPNKTSDNPEIGAGADAAEISAPEFSGNVVALPLTKNNNKGIQGKEERKKSSESTRARGTRMQAGAVIPEEWECWAVNEWLKAGGRYGEGEWAEFVDYWVAVSGQRGVKSDWFATWRNNVRRNIRMRKNAPRNSSRKDEWREVLDQAREYGSRGNPDAGGVS